MALDFTDPTTFAPALEGVSKVFLIRPPAVARVGNTINSFIDAAQDHRVDHIVFSSVAGADTNKVVPHHRIETHLQGSKMAWTMLRPGFFAQNIGTAYHRDIVANNRIYLPAGRGRVAFIDTRDIAEVAAVALTEEGHEGRGYHLTGPEAVSFNHVARLLSETIGRTISYEPSSILGYLRHLRQQGMIWPQAVVQTVLHAGLRRGDAEAVTTTVTDLVGRPARSVEDYINDHAASWSTDSER